MKAMKLLSSAALATTIFSVGTLSAFAATDGGAYTSKGLIEFKPSTEITDPTNPLDPEEPVTPVDPDGETPEPGTPGPLSIDFASSFDFGTQEISSKEQTYYAAVQKVIAADGETKNVPNYVQVTDNRGTEAGWGLTVTQDTEFISTKNAEHTLAGSEIVISNIDVATVSESDSPSIVNTEITLTGAESTDVVMAAADGEGAGTYLATFGNDETKAGSVALNVPGSITKYAEEYQTTITWTLTDTPANVQS